MADSATRAGLASSRRWTVLPRDERAERRLADQLGVSPLVARVLAARGMSDPEVARRFLEPSLERDWVDPLLVPGLAEAADRVERAVRSGETIAVFGDFDVDGMSSTALLTLALRRLGAHVCPFIPHRFGEGYGLSREALARVAQECSPDLLVTVDNGISACEEVAWLRGRGVDVVVTDHHEPSGLVPRDVPVADPKLCAECPSHDLAGVGVALKLVCVVGACLGQPDLWRDYLDVASLGTLSDMMPLTGENRSIVAEGIARMRVRTRPGLVALAACAGLDMAEVTADGLPFSVIPRLNAAGRMGTTDVALRLLLTDDPAEAATLAGQLDATNNLRRETEAALTEQAMAQAAETWSGGRCVVVGDEGWHEGVKGIVASRLVGRYHVPSIVFTVEGGVARGSGRSVGSVDLFHAVESCSDMLLRFGGHAGAVGVTCEASRLDEFRERLGEALSALPPEAFEDAGEVAAVVRPEELTMESIESLERLQPFGQCNKKPLLACVGVSMRSRALVGAQGTHLRFVASDGVAAVPAIMFRVPDPRRAETCEGVVDLVFEPVNETWQGRTKPKLMVKDILYRDAPEGAHGPVDDLLDAAEREAADAGSVGAAPQPPVAPRGAAACADVDAGAAALRAGLSRLGAAELDEELRARLIGDHALLAAQRRALATLAEGRSCLCVMATGRGKSLVFHMHAARLALREGRASVFVYPLRALVADQAVHLRRSLAPLGIVVEVLTGESSPDERARVLAALRDGGCDVVLTTPEFLDIHSAELAACGRVGFLAVDEAHHAGQARGGQRSSYLELPRVVHDLGDPVVLAATATAAPEVAREVCRLCGVAEPDVLVDAHVRDNLHLDDCRDLRDRESALAGIVARGEKTVVYVNTRDQAVSLVRLLRHRVPELAHRIAFYHAGLPRADRARVERAFRADELVAIVSTSAFGEGVNLPGIRHVVLYNLPLGEVEFNQMSGRAGRDGADALVHLLYGARDVRVDEAVIASSCPDRRQLVALWRALRSAARQAAGTLDVDREALLGAALSADPGCALVAAGVDAGLAVFDELGLCELSGFGDALRASVGAAPGRVELERSVRFVEGGRTREAFSSFSAWALGADADELLARIARPIVPDFGIIVTDGEE